MNPEDPVCLCFHVTRRKVLNYIRIEKPRRASQLSECYGAGTGCGWCRKYLARLLKESLHNQDETNSQDTPEVSFDEYARQRAQYVREGGGTPPPGALPLPTDSHPPDAS